MRLPVLVASSALLLALSACGKDAAAPAESPSPSAPATSESTSAAPTDTPTSSADLALAPGRIGPVEAGMTQREAAATGLFDTDVTDDGCGIEQPLAWKKAFTGVDVLTNESGDVTTLGVTDADGPRTADGLGVGSTVGELIETYGGDLSGPEEAGYGQIGVYVRDGDAWLGFLIGKAGSVDEFDNDPGLEVTFAEVTQGQKPDLQRDGC